MLKILKGHEETMKGVVVCQESGSASSLPFVLHFLSTAANSGQKIAIVTSYSTETNYKLICSKAGVRWIPSQISFFNVIDKFASFDVSAKKLLDHIKNRVSESEATSVLFDDLSILEQFGATPVEVTVFVHEMYSVLRGKCSTPPLVLAPFSIPSRATELLLARCNVFAEITPVGHGFGKDASTKVILTIRSSDEHVTKKCLLLTGERTINGTWVPAQ